MSCTQLIHLMLLLSMNDLKFLFAMQQLGYSIHLIFFTVIYILIYLLIYFQGELTLHDAEILAGTFPPMISGNELNILKLDDDDPVCLGTGSYGLCVLAQMHSDHTIVVIKLFIVGEEISQHHLYQTK